MLDVMIMDEKKRKCTQSHRCGPENERNVNRLFELLSLHKEFFHCSLLHLSDTFAVSQKALMPVSGVGSALGDRLVFAGSSEQKAKYAVFSRSISLVFFDNYSCEASPLETRTKQ